MMPRDLTRSTRSRTVPLPRPWGADVPANHVIVVRARRWTTGGRAPGSPGRRRSARGPYRRCWSTTSATRSIGLDPHPEVVWDRLWRHLREAGPGGITTIALAGVDLALWDLRCGERGLADVARAGGATASRSTAAA